MKICTARIKKLKTISLYLLNRTGFALPGKEKHEKKFKFRLPAVESPLEDCLFR
jgi:hypothetical protein